MAYNPHIEPSFVDLPRMTMPTPTWDPVAELQCDTLMVDILSQLDQHAALARKMNQHMVATLLSATRAMLLQWIEKNGFTDKADDLMQDKLDMISALTRVLSRYLVK